MQFTKIDIHSFDTSLSVVDLFIFFKYNKINKLEFEEDK